jgi:hypothetical protein
MPNVVAVNNSIGICHVDGKTFTPEFPFDNPSSDGSITAEPSGVALRQVSVTRGVLMDEISAFGLHPHTCATRYVLLAAN